ncbi:MAG TPA: galactose-1-epimerase, partial [Spirochaetaceae bacterium]|nr:galactose-1-epimerase [Spirochaetaceae bacterium]
AITGKSGSIYDKYAGFCLETEMYPDSPNQQNFPSCFLFPGKPWEHETVYRFDIQY